MTDKHDWIYPSQALEIIQSELGYRACGCRVEVLVNAIQGGDIEATGVPDGSIAPRRITSEEMTKCDMSDGGDCLYWKKQVQAAASFGIAFTNVRLDGNALAKYLRKYYPSIPNPSNVSLETRCKEWLECLPS